MRDTCIAGLDIGTAVIKLVVADEVDGRVVPRLFLHEPAAGVRKGAVIEPTELAAVLSKLFAEARQLSKNATKNLFVTIGSTQLQVQSSRGIVAVSRADAEIYQDDVDRVIKASQALNLGPNRTLLHNIVREFIVDGTPDIADPLGLTGSRLEVQSLVIDVFSMHIKNAMRAIELAGGEVRSLTLTPLASARAALTKRQKELGAAVIDLGAGVTGLTVYDEHKLVGIAQIGLGGGNVTSDIAIGCKIPVADAENVKLKYGHAVPKSVGARDLIDIRQGSPEAPKNVTRRFVADIIESRMQEILELVGSELEAMGKGGKLPEGIILVGGGAKLPGIVDLARRELKLNVEVAHTLGDGWSLETAGLAGDLNAPEFAAALGLVLGALDEAGGGSGGRRGSKGMKLARGWLSYFLP